jgi:GTP-binding protein Era
MTNAAHFHAGFANIIGFPNVGKSTFLNALLEEKISIVTPKRQTTRHRIRGIITGRQYQLVLSDTPGILEPKYLLQQRMMQFVNQAMEDADIFVYMVEATDDPLNHEPSLNKLLEKGVPVLILINKVDQTNQQALAELVERYHKWVSQDDVIPIAAAKGFNIGAVLKRLVEMLPEGQPYFPDDQVIDKSERFIISEAIREQVLIKFKQEIPYSIEVEIEEFEELADIVNIRAAIIANKQSQKPILIGKQGSALKQIGKNARGTMEAFLNKQVYLELFVKVRENWRNSAGFLNQHGYASS